MVPDILMNTDNLLVCSTTGAGYHSESKAKEYKHVCKRACQKVWYKHFSFDHKAALPWNSKF